MCMLPNESIKLHSLGGYVLICSFFIPLTTKGYNAISAFISFGSISKAECNWITLKTDTSHINQF